MIPIFVFSSGPTWNILDELKAEKADLRLQYFTSALSLSNKLKNFESAIVLLLIREKSDFFQIETFLNMIRSLSKAKSFRLVMVPFLIDKIFSRLGINEVLAVDITKNYLHEKIEFWMTNLKAQEIQKKEVQIVHVDPIQCSSDIWLCIDSVKPKKVTNKWLVCLTGLSPNVCRWVDHNPGEWKLEIVPELKDQFCPDGGNWFFKGESRPDFFWQDSHWLLFGEEFELSFQTSVSIFRRVCATGNILTVCRNSSFAEGKKEKILSTFETVIPIRLKAIDDDHEILEILKNDLDKDDVDVELITFNATVEIILHQNGLPVKVHLDDRIEGNIIFVTDVPSLELNKNVMVNISFKLLSKNIQVNLNGPILKVHEENGAFYYDLQVEDQDKFDLIQKLFELRQKMISRFHALASGF